MAKQPTSANDSSGKGTKPAARVKILARSFDPAQVTIEAGQQVLWTNVDSGVHIVASNPGAKGCQPPSPTDFLSYDLHQNDQFAFEFATAGTYHYHCFVVGCSMAGSVTVI